MERNETFKTHRRTFLGTLATGAAALSLGAFAAPLQALANPEEAKHYLDDADAWLKQVKPKQHKVVFDVTQPKEILPFAWPRVYLMTNEMTGSKPKDVGVVVILRHDAIPYAMEDRVWTKYNFGQQFKADDPATKTASLRNPFWKPKAGDFQVPGVGNVAIGINELQDSGVMFGVCNVALSVNSAIVAKSMNMNAEDVKKDWVSALLPGIKVVPSGVWAVARAQEYGCAYIFAG